MKDDYILIVDDELPIREMIHTALDMAGFQCLQAEDAKQAHQMIGPASSIDFAGLDDARWRQWCRSVPSSET